MPEHARRLDEDDDNWALANRGRNVYLQKPRTLKSVRKPRRREPVSAAEHQNYVDLIRVYARVTGCRPPTNLVPEGYTEDGWQFDNPELTSEWDAEEGDDWRDDWSQHGYLNP